MTRQTIDAVMETEVGLNIHAIYSYDIPVKILQFYQVDVEISEQGKRMKTKIFRLKAQPRELNPEEFMELRKQGNFKEKTSKKNFETYKEESRDNINNQKLRSISSKILMQVSQRTKLEIASGTLYFAVCMDLQECDHIP